jgi:hypothetical protein
MPSIGTSLFFAGRACLVCGMRDVRALTTTALATGGSAVVCGTHELMHRRAGNVARDENHLRAIVAERRKSTERRARVLVFDGAELVPFMEEEERRVNGDRRRGTPD